MSMHWFLNFLYGSTPAEFESEFGLEESVQRLAAATCRLYSLLHLVKQTAVGRVTARRVSLQRVIPFVGNSFKPFFRGSFQQAGNRVLLTGRFTLHPLAKVFMTFWFGFLAFWTTLATTFTILALFRGKTSFDGDVCYWWFPLAGIGMFLWGLGLVGLCKWFARNDTRWLSSVIQNALRK